jgi:hypothetical protein
MIELGLLGLLVFVLVYSITLLRCSLEKSEEEYSDPDVPKDHSNVVAQPTGAAQ